MLGALHRCGVKRSNGPRPKRIVHWFAWAGFLTMVVWTSPTIGRHRLRAVGRFWLWQLWRRIAGRSIRVILPQGWQLEFPPWSELAGITAATGLHEPAEELFVFSYLRSGDHVVDVGSNIGIYTVACAALGARVSSFEPASSARGALTKNVKLNQVDDRVRIFPTALGDVTASGALTTDLDVGNHLIAADGVRGMSEVVGIQPLDALVNEENEWFATERIALLKIDVEGHDAAVLRGARTTLEDHRPVILVETWEGGGSIRAFLSEFEYRVYRFDINGLELVEYPASWSGQANFIAIPNERLEFVEQRLVDRPPLALALPRIQWWIAGP